MGLSRRAVLLIGTIFHICFLRSIFDIYFVTPLVHGMQHHRVEAEAPAKRLFLVVGDGLRADKLYQSHDDPDTDEHRYLAPFIRSKVLNEGTFGVSHTRVPTESRPGHVAIIAGFYEDVSAVTKGWKMNPVNFDSVFNQSRHTWSFGSPDILPMFAHGASDEDRVETWMYAEEEEDFSKDATALDTWVFDHVSDLFHNASSNPVLDAALRQDQNVFFLHLLGCDTTGHAYRPYSKEYLRNIKVVDEGVEATVKLVNDFYGDDKTAWIFTADHGMSDFGSHGDGHPDNTRTPIVAWGAGVAKPDTANPIGHDDGFSDDWGLSAVRRNDINQADIAPLMASLIGINYPVNSVGELPLQFIDAEPAVKAEMAFVNAKQIVEQYRVKHMAKAATELAYKPFPLLEEEGQSDIERIQGLVDAEQYEQATDECLQLAEKALAGLKYLQRYDWLFLRSLVTAGYLGWIVFAFTYVMNEYVLHDRFQIKRPIALKLFSMASFTALCALIWVQQMPASYYAYAFFPVLFWQEAIATRDALFLGLRQLLDKVSSPLSYLSVLAKTILYIGLLEAMVFGYFQRLVFSACFIFASVWPLSRGVTFVKQHKLLSFAWAALCLVMSTFTTLNVVKQEDERQIMVGGGLMLAIGCIYLLFSNRVLHASSKPSVRNNQKEDAFTRTIIGVQVGLVALAMVVTHSSVQSLRAKQGLPFGTQVVGWATLIASLMVPFLHVMRPKHHYLHRLVIIFLAFSPTFIILTISYEGIFYVVFFAMLSLWVEMEGAVFKAGQKGVVSKSGANAKKSRQLTLGDTRIALFFFFLIQVAFFWDGEYCFDLVFLVGLGLPVDSGVQPVQHGSLTAIQAAYSVRGDFCELGYLE
ncbi:Glycosyl phosphatidyl inositol anchor synthesis [Saitoella coloradoensis]